MTITTATDLIGNYGPNRDRRGILVDHVEWAATLGATTHITPSGRMWVTPAPKAPAVLVLCGDLIEVYDEDGKHTGRCGKPIAADWGFCSPPHDIQPGDTCEHGMSAALCAGPGHYPLDR